MWPQSLGSYTAEIGYPVPPKPSKCCSHTFLFSLMEVLKTALPSFPTTSSLILCWTKLPSLILIYPIRATLSISSCKYQPIPLHFRYSRGILAIILHPLQPIGSNSNPKGPYTDVPYNESEHRALHKWSCFYSTD